MTTIQITDDARTRISALVAEVEQLINDSTHELAIDLITAQSPAHALNPDSPATDQLLADSQDELLALTMSKLTELIPIN